MRSRQSLDKIGSECRLQKDTNKVVFVAMWCSRTEWWLCLFGFALFDDAAGIADGDTIGGNVMGNNRACADSAVIADSNARENGNRASYPTVVSDSNRLRPFLACIALGGIGAMAGSVDRYIRSDESIIADSNECFIENRKMKIGKESLTYTDMFTIVAVKWLIDKDILITTAEQVLQKG